MPYRIRDWDQLFENNRTRELKKIDWVPVPNRMDGDGYTALVTHPNGAAHLGAWLAILEICSRQKIRGSFPESRTFPQDGAERCGAGSHPPATREFSLVFSRMSRLPSSVFEEVIPRLVEIGWVECFQTDTEIPHFSAPSCDLLPMEGKRIEGKGIQEKRARARPSAAASPSTALARMPRATEHPRFQQFWKLYPRRQHQQKAAEAFVKLVDEDSEEACFECLKRYLASSDVANGAIQNPERWLAEQAADSWRGTWPAAPQRASPQMERHQTTIQIANAIERRMGR